MTEGNLEKKEIRGTKHLRKLLWPAAIVLAIIIVVLVFFRWNSRELLTIDEKLAAIEAARAIPDCENAAIIYNQLFAAWDANSFEITFIDKETEWLTRNQPWQSKDYPEISDWLAAQQNVIVKLFEASKLEKCRFPIPTDLTQIGVIALSTIRQFVFLLVRAANNDVAEGRIDAALEKHLCLIKMGNHLRQQTVMIDYLVGIDVEAIGLHAMARLIVEGDVTETHLATIDKFRLDTNDTWSEDSNQMLEVEKLFQEKAKEKMSLVARVNYWLSRGKFEESMRRMHEIYLRLLTDRRGIQILIALRRYKNQTDHWPETLDEVEASLSKEIRTDPHNGGPFVYKLTGDGFKLYSKGKNNIDENGIYRSGYTDDWPIWPPRQSQKPKKQETYKLERNTDSVGKVIPEQNIAQLPGQKVEGAKMIVDRIENAHLYASLNDRFTKAFEILADRTLSSKQDGRYAVEGNDLYYIVQHYTTRPMEKDKLEAHRKYIDIQVVLSGEESLAYAPIEGLAVAQPYSEDKDIAFYHAPDKISTVTLRPGVFCILFPQDGHIPCCQLNGLSNVHKVVVKVRIDTVQDK